MKHEIKIREDYIEPILAKEKTFEVRENDRGYQKGDLVKFIPVNRQGITYRDPILEEKTYQITYVHSGLGLKEGYVVFGIKELYHETEG